ncbi:MAG: hypothetical protein ACREX8_05270 [Gammaproteobacteria bacterium]
MPSEEETYRATLQVRTPDGQPHTLIVTRRNTRRPARVWLTLNGAWKTTVHLTDPEAAQLAEQLTQAQHQPPAPRRAPHETPDAGERMSHCRHLH